MTDTAREAAIERVRAWLNATLTSSDGVVIDRVFDPSGVIDLTLGDLRLVLSGGEGGRLDAEPRLHVDGSTVAGLRTALAKVDAADMACPARTKAISGKCPKCRADASQPCGPVLSAEYAVVQAVRAALTDPRQPSEAPVTAGRFGPSIREIEFACLGVHDAIERAKLRNEPNIVCMAYESADELVSLLSRVRNQMVDAAVSLPPFVTPAPPTGEVGGL